MRRKLMLCMTFLLVVIGLVNAQVSKVTGVVTSEEDGLPVIGASVLVKGTSVGTVTDIDGKFTINNVPGSAKTLLVSFIGLQSQEVAIQPEVNVVLKSDTELLEEVVVTGYGSAKKLGSVVGSVSSIGGEKLENKPIANMGDALQGQVAGLQVLTSSGEPSAGSSMRLRGVSSISGSSTPLFILDGAPISEAAFTALNANDIESMTVLKDASSTAIYGSRAANGVVILTSKKGKRGSKARVSLTAQYGFSKAATNENYAMNAGQWYQLQEMIDPDKKDDVNFQAEKNFYIDNGLSTDWADVFFGGTAPMQQYDLNVTGGSKSLSYYFSAGHLQTDGIMDDSSLRRETLRSNIDANITSWLKTGVNIGLSYQKSTTTAFGTSGNSLYNKVFASSMYLPTQMTHEVLRAENGDFIGFGDKLDYYDGMGLYDPYYLSRIQPGDKDVIRINASTYFNINPIKGLNIRAAQAMEYYDQRGSQKSLAEGPFAGNATASESFGRSYQFTYTNTAEYKFTVARQHDFTLLAGQESIISKAHSFGTSVSGIKDIAFSDISAGSKAGLPTYAESDVVYNSFFGTLSYAFDSRYFLDAAYRRDGSSLFAKDHQWGNFWSVGVMWNLKNENFLKNVKWVDDLRLKVSYGSIGNSSSLSPYMALDLVGMGPIYGGNKGSAPSNVANHELTWEVVKSANVGLSARLFNRVNVDLDFYDKKTEDMLMSVPFSYTTGFSGGWVNVGAMRNRGFDLAFGVDILQNLAGVNWSVKANINYNKNEILELFGGRDEYVIPNTGLKLQTGKPYGEFYYNRWHGVNPETGVQQWLDKDGNVTEEFRSTDAVFTGKNQYAPWSGGFGTQLSWKGITVAADFSFMLDRWLLNNVRYFTENPANASQWNQSTEMLNMWMKPGDITDIPGVNEQRQFDTHLLENAAFMRLKNLTVSYTLPSQWIRKSGVLSDAKVFFVGRNLWTVTGYTGFDPEVDSNLSLGNYPNTKQFSFGVELKF